MLEEFLAEAAEAEEERVLEQGLKAVQEEQEPEERCEYGLGNSEHRRT